MNNTERLKNIKIIVSDLDGTLLSDSGAIGIETKQLINQLQDCGIIFALATGRLHSAVTSIAEELSIKSPIISLDGSMIRSIADGSRIYESFVKKSMLKERFKFAEEQLLNIVLCHDEAIYYTDRNSNMPVLSR